MRTIPESPPAEFVQQYKKRTSIEIDANIISANNSITNSTTIVNEKQSRITLLVNFFNQLYSKIPEPHFAYLFTKQRGIFPFQINDESQRMAMAIKAVELSSIGVDVWHSVNTVSVQPTNGKRGDETIVSYQTAIVTDIDISGSAHKSTNLVVNFDQAKSFLPIKPSILLDSGHGAQAYYIFNQPILITEQNLFMFAQQGGYDAKDIYREWYELYPSLRPSAKRNMDVDTKHALDKVFILLETLELENFTANDAYAPENLHAVALATAYGFPALAKKFFDTIKAAQKLAKIRIADSKSELTAKLSAAEKKL